MVTRWTSQQMPDLKKSIVLITGSNSGIGFETAKALAAHNATVVMAVRNVEQGRKAATRIQQDTNNPDVNVLPLDLSDLSSVASFATEFTNRYGQLRLLINNAGVMAPPYQTTKDGFELQFGTNHLGHFALTAQLLPLILTAPAARVVTVSSMAHTMGKILFGNLDGSKGYKKWLFYGQSKLANLLFAYELQRRFTANGVDVKSIACHPGFASTNLISAHRAGALAGIANLFAQSAEMGALPTLYAATHPDLLGGEYIGPKRRTRGTPIVTTSNEPSHDVETAKKLWDVSERLTGVSFAAVLPNKG